MKQGIAERARAPLPKSKAPPQLILGARRQASTAISRGIRVALDPIAELATLKPPSFLPRALDK